MSPIFTLFSQEWLLAAKDLGLKARVVSRKISRLKAAHLKEIFGRVVSRKISRLHLLTLP